VFCFFGSSFRSWGQNDVTFVANCVERNSKANGRYYEKQTDYWMKTNVEKCNPILFAWIVLVDVLVSNVLICLVVVFVCGREVITVPQETPFHEVVCVSGGIYPHSENLRTTWRWQLTFTLRMYYRRSKNARYFSDNTRVVGTQSLSGPCGAEKNVSPWREFSSDGAFRSLVTILTELYVHPRLISFRESLDSEIKHMF
jgi:hypothetical protein